MTILVLGTNDIVDCQPVVRLAGVEVFRLRERTSDGRLVVDFDLRRPDGRPLARIAASQAVSLAPGYEFKSRVGVAEVVDTTTGAVRARAKELRPGRIKLVGQFCIGAYRVDITGNEVRLAGRGVSGKTIPGDDRPVDFLPDADAPWPYRTEGDGSSALARAALRTRPGAHYP